MFRLGNYPVYLLILMSYTCGCKVFSVKGLIMITRQSVIEAYKWRHACKEFVAGQKISEDDIKFLFDTISLSPSSFGLQPYDVFVLSNQELLKELHPHMWGAQKQLFSASHALMFAARKDVTVDDGYFHYVLRDVQQAPAEVVELYTGLVKEHQLREIKISESSRYLVEWAAKQAYIALGNLMTAAAIIGIDSCPVEGFVSDEINQILLKHKVLDPENYQVAVFCFLGYRLNEPVRPKTRRPIEGLIKFIN